MKRPRHAILRLVAGLAVASMLADCGGVPESRNIRLDAVGPVAAAPAPLKGAVQVLPFNARGVLSDRRLAYVDSSGVRRQSATILWEEPPAQAAAIVMAGDLRAARLADAVFAPDQPGFANTYVSARIDRFELAGNRAVVALSVAAFRGPAREPILAADYCAAENVADGSAGSIERGFDGAYGRILSSLVHDLAVPAAAPGSTAGTSC